MISLVVGVVAVLGISVLGVKMFFSDNGGQDKYTIIMNATGEASYLYLYKTFGKDETLGMDEILKVKITPGIKSYIDEPKEVGKLFDDALTKAKTFIPDAKIKQTPIVLRATEELWLQPAVALNAVFDNLNKHFEKSGFFYDKFSVGILNNKDEALYSWYLNSMATLTKNPATQFSEHSTSTTLYVTDTSAQIAFVPGQKEVIEKDDPKHVVFVMIEKTYFYLYFRSYLDAGLLSARKKLLTVFYPKFSTGLPKYVSVNSACIKSGTTWEYDGTTYTVSSNNVASITACDSLVSRLIKSLRIYKPAEIKNKEVNVKSYIADIAKEYGLAQKEWDSFTLSQLIETKIKECGYGKGLKPFACLDLTYITKLLNEGFGLDPETKLTIVTENEGTSLVWPGYYALNISTSNEKLNTPKKIIGNEGRN